MKRATKPGRKASTKTYVEESNKPNDRVIRSKFQDEREQQIASKPLVAMNERQSEYIDAIRTKQLVIATGFAGSSKTYIAASMAADAFRRGEISKIYLCRPNISNSQSLGFFSGDVNQKLRNWLMPLISVLYQRMGKAAVNIALEAGDIELLPLETIKGMSFNEHCWVLVDEAEDLTIEEVKCITTRAGGCKMILSGDTRQSALFEDSGLATFFKMVDSSPRLQESIGHICFDEYSHIVRSKLCKDLIIAFDKVGL